MKSNVCSKINNLLKQPLGSELPRRAPCVKIPYCQIYWVEEASKKNLLLKKETGLCSTKNDLEFKFFYGYAEELSKSLDYQSYRLLLGNNVSSSVLT